MSYLYFPIAGLFVAVLLIILFFSKRKLPNVETQYYGILIISSLFNSILTIILVYLGMFDNYDYNMMIFFNRLNYFSYIIWIVAFFAYMFDISLKNKKIYKYKKIIFIFIYFLSGVGSLLVLFLPMLLINSINSIIPYGPAVTIFYGLFICFIFIILITFVSNIKNFFSKKYLPLYMLFGMAILGFYLHNTNPELLITSCVIVYINLIMYFTIENPDLKLLDRLEIAYYQIKRTNQAKGDFLTSLSHEIRTPLNTIIGLSEDINKYKNDLPKEVLENNEDILNASNTLMTIVDSIAYANTTDMKTNQDDEKYLVNREIKKITDQLTPKIIEKNIDFIVEIAPDLPYELIGNKNRVKKIIELLLTNALNYTETGTIILTIKCLNNNDVCSLMISVNDTGKGINNKKLKRINKIFKQKNYNLKDDQKNKDIYLCKELVDKMSGTITVQSELNKGSLFIVQINQKISLLLNQIPEINQSEINSNQFNYGPKRILIVDDNKLNIKVVRKALADFNFAIDSCESGLDCIKIINKGYQYDLILMDIMMPNMNGKTTLKYLKQNEKFETPVIALTADATYGAKEKYVSQGFVDYIAKPFNRKQIKEKIDSIFLK